MKKVNLNIFIKFFLEETFQAKLSSQKSDEKNLPRFVGNFLELVFTTSKIVLQENFVLHCVVVNQCKYLHITGRFSQSAGLPFYFVEKIFLKERRK